ncbi:MAG: hypothetical protein ACP5U1_12895 [Desulfomonilaceae bacterium]
MAASIRMGLQIWESPTVTLSGKMSDKETNNIMTPPKGRYILGVFFFSAGMGAPLLVPVVVASSLPSAWKATISGLLALGIPEVLMGLAAVVLGKSGFNYLKQKAYGLFRRFALPKKVSRARYHVGLMLFTLPVITSWLWPYLSSLFMIDFWKSQLIVSALSDLIFLISLFVLGGAFWDKLKALFIYEAKVQYSECDNARKRGI